MSELLIPVAVSSELDITGEERIHVANPAIVIRPVYIPAFDNLWITYSGSLTLRYSIDAAQLDYSNTVASGGFSSSSAALQRIHAVNGRLFRTGTGGTNRSRTTTDGVTFVSMTGTAFTTAVSTVLHNGTEWLFFQSSTTTTLGVSTNGIAVTSRVLPSAFTNGMVAQKDTTIVGASNAGVTVSTDSGATFSAGVFGGVTPFTTLNTVATANRFVALGYNSTTQVNTCKWSTTGAVGTWTDVTMIGSSGTNRIAGGIYNPLTNRIIAVNGTGLCYYSDDEGDTWATGGTIPQYFSTMQLLFANNKVYHMSGDATALNAKIYSTTDGVTWTLVFTQLDWESAIGLHMTHWDIP